MSKIPFAKLMDAVTHLFERVGLREPLAREEAELFVHTEAKGVFSHGLDLVLKHVQQMVKGNMNLESTVKVVREAGAFAVLDGDRGPGPVVVNRALDVGMEKAKTAGVASVWITNLQHYAAGLTYAAKAVRSGMIVTMCANSPPSMAPFGGVKKLYGTNPFTFGAPAGKYPPYILDMATTVVAGNKIEYYMKANQPVPTGYGLDRHGAASTDPVEIMKYGSLMPFGGAKGSGIAGMVNLLSGILSGGGFAEEVVSLCRDVKIPANYGCYINLIHIDSVMGAARYTERMEQWIAKILANPPAKGFERVVYPGLIEEEKFQRAQREGVEVADGIYQQLVEAGGLVGLDMAKELA